jgi:hypothetical protein
VVDKTTNELFEILFVVQLMLRVQQRVLTQYLQT